MFHVKPNVGCRTSHAADVLRVYVRDPTTLDPAGPAETHGGWSGVRAAGSGATADVASLAPCALFHVKRRAASVRGVSRTCEPVRNSLRRQHLYAISTVRARKRRLPSEEGLAKHFTGLRTCWGGLSAPCFT